jgi:hypothetical protein
VEGKKASGGGRDSLKSLQATIMGRRGHTSRQGFHAHCPVRLHCASSLSKLAYGESLQLQV